MSNLPAVPPTQSIQPLDFGRTDQLIIPSTDVVLTQYDTTKYNVLPLPTVPPNGDNVLVVTRILINIQDKAQVYQPKDAAGQLALHDYPLQLIAQAAGLSTALVAWQVDHDTGSATVTAAGRLQIAPNDYRHLTATAVFDVPTRYEGEKAKAEAITDPRQKAAAIAKLPSVLARLKAYSLARADSGARNRVIRKLLCMRAAYPVPELQKGFIVARIQYQPQNPLLQAALRLQQANLGAALFGDANTGTAAQRQIADLLIAAANPPPPPVQQPAPVQLTQPPANAEHVTDDEAEPADEGPLD